MYLNKSKHPAAASRLSTYDISVMHGSIPTTSSTSSREYYQTRTGYTIITKKNLSLDITLRGVSERKKSTMGSHVIKTHRQVLDITLATLRFLGLWSIDPTSSTLTKLSYSIYKKAMVILVCTFAVALLADLCESYSDLFIVTDDGCFLAGIFVVIFKLFVFQLRRERIQELIDRIHKPIELLRCSSDEGVLKTVKTCIFWEQLVFASFSTLAAVLTIAVIFFVPTEKGELPIRARYPFETAEPPLHNVAFVLQASAVAVGLASITVMDKIALGLCSWLKVQFIVLASNYENCSIENSERAYINNDPAKRSEKSSRSMKRKDVFPISSHTKEIRCFIPFELEECHAEHYEAADCFVTRFKLCIKHHQRLISIADEMNAIFNSSMLVQLLSSSSMICFTGFQAVLGARQSASLMKFTLYLGAAFTQLLNWCYFGNQLIYQSTFLAECQWFSGWENELSPEVAFLVIFSLIRTRKALELKAGKFYNMSMETFLSILRASYSFFALLLSSV